MQIDKVKEFFKPEAMELRMRTLGEGRINFCNLGSDDGRLIRHFQMITPIVMSNRSLIGCFYPVEDPSDGSFTFLISMRGNEKLVEEYQHRLSQDVLGYALMNYSKYTPYDGGCYIEMCLCLDVKGSIPNFMKNLLSYKQANAPREFWEFIVNGAVPVSGF